MSTSCECLLGAMGKYLSKNKKKSRTNGSVYQVTAEYDQPVVRRYPPCHNEAVMAVAPVGQGLCLSGSKDQSVVVFDFNLGQIRQRWMGHDKEVTKVVCGKELDAYFSCSRDKTVCMWQDGVAEPTRTFCGHELIVTGLALNSENTLLCTGSRDNVMKMWDIQTGSCIAQNNISRNLITHIKWEDNSNIIAQTGEDKEVKIWDATNLKVIKAFPRKQHIQTCCDISGDSIYCLTSSNGFQGNGCEATLWDIRSGSIVSEYKGHNETVGACCFLPACMGDGRKLLATCSNDCSVRVWDQDTTECVAEVCLPGSGPLTSLAVWNDGSICVASFNSGVYVLKLGKRDDGEFELMQTAQF